MVQLQLPASALPRADAPEESVCSRIPECCHHCVRHSASFRFGWDSPGWQHGSFSATEPRWGHVGIPQASTVHECPLLRSAGDYLDFSWAPLTHRLTDAEIRQLAERVTEVLEVGGEAVANPFMALCGQYKSVILGALAEMNLLR